VRVRRDPIFVRDGNVYTSAGVTAGIDLAAALVEEDLGAKRRWRSRAGWCCSCAVGQPGAVRAQLALQEADREPLARSMPAVTPAEV